MKININNINVAVNGLVAKSYDQYLKKLSLGFMDQGLRTKISDSIIIFQSIITL